MTTDNRIRMVQWFWRWQDNWPNGADDTPTEAEAAQALQDFENGKDAWQSAADIWQAREDAQ